MKRLVLVRHGESTWNAESRIQGQLGNGLSPRGHRQAGAVARYLADTYPRPLVVTSDLQRCRETVAPLEAALGRRGRLDEGLRERDYGDWSGRLSEDLREEEPERWQRWKSGDDVVGEVGGEATATFTKRVLAALEGILAELPDDNDVICVTHGGPVWYGTRALVDLHEEALGGVANASVTEILVDQAFGRRLATWNQVAHLPPELRTFLRRVEPARRPEA